MKFSMDKFEEQVKKNGGFFVGGKVIVAIETWIQFIQIAIFFPGILGWHSLLRIERLPDQCIGLRSQ